MKEVIGKKRISANQFHKKIILNNCEITNNSLISNSFNHAFVNTGPSLSLKVKKSKTSFESYLTSNNYLMENNELSEQELFDAVNLLKSNKGNGVDDVSSNIIIKSIYHIKIPLLHIFSLSLEQGIFPDKLKVARVIPVLKSGDATCVTNYRPISILPCFSKILEHIMYKRLYHFLDINNILYSKQFGFKNGHSTDQAIAHLVHDILKSFDENKYTLGVFIDLSKAFDTVNHYILLTKLKNYGVKHSNFKWFKSYLSNRQQYISHNCGKTNNMNITCGVPQGSILGPLLFLIYINDLSKSCSVLDSILFADDTNLFYAHNDIRILFKTVNIELQYLAEWFRANKLSLNLTKTKYTFFHRYHERDKIPLKLPNLCINNYEIKREVSLNFLGVLLDENVAWRAHIKYIEGKISRNIGLLYRAKPFLNPSCLKLLYFSFIHSYLNYANIAWCSTNKNKLKKLFNMQKHAIRIISNERRYTPSQPLFINLNILNIYQINIYHILIFMFKINKSIIPKIFNPLFKINENKYLTRYSNNRYIQPKSYFAATEFSISIRGPKAWNKILPTELKALTMLNEFKSKLRQLLLKNDLPQNYF